VLGWAEGHRPGSRHGAADRWRGMLATRSWPARRENGSGPPHDESGARLLVVVNVVPA
jgi:hypothetical protein